MKKMLVLVLVLMAVVSYTAEEKDKDQIPKELQSLKDAANKETEAAVNAVTAPILKKYKGQLEALQKKYVTAKDARGISAVAKEIEIVDDGLTADADFAVKMIGKFKNPTYTIEILPGNKATLSSGFTANVAIKKKMIRFFWNNGTAWTFNIVSSNRFYDEFEGVGDKSAFVRIDPLADKSKP